MNKPKLFRKIEEREFFAHHMLLHAAELEISSAKESQVGRFNKCLAAMVMTAIAVESLLNAVGSRTVKDWLSFEQLRPHEKIDLLVEKLQIQRDLEKEPWTTLMFLAGFRNDIVHAKPEPIIKKSVLPEVALAKTDFDKPHSKLEREITLGNARRVFSAVHKLKSILTDAMPAEERFGIYADMWSGSTTEHEA
jgi:hypothetical protein